MSKPLIFTIVATLLVGLLVITPNRSIADEIVAEKGSMIVQETKIPKRNGGFRIVYNAYELNEPAVIYTAKPPTRINDAGLLKSMSAGISAMYPDGKFDPGTSTSLYPMGATVLDIDNKDTGHKAGAVYVVKGAWRVAGTQGRYAIPDGDCLRCELNEKQVIDYSRGKSWEDGKAILERLITNTTWLYNYKGNDFAITFADSGDIQGLDTWKDVQWRASSANEVALTAPNGQKMVLRFNDSRTSFSTADWDGTAATGRPK